MLEHTEECTRASKRYAAEVAEFEKAHPHYCRHCWGWGYFEYTYDPSPSGVSLGSGWMIDVELCPECTEEDICPWCGSEMGLMGDPDLEDYPYEFATCACGYGPDNYHGIPEGPECYCWEIL